MKILVILSILVICNLSFISCASVGQFLKSYANAPNNEVRKILVQNMLGDINGRSIEDIFNNYDETEEYEYDQMLRNRDFLRKEDREHLDNMLKYTKVANSKWGQLLLHPEKIPNPASFLQWDMKKLIKQSLRNPEIRRWILRTMLQNLKGSHLEKIRETMKEKLGDNYQNATNYLNSILMGEDIKVDNNFRNSFQATDADTCREAIEATWGYPLDILGDIIKLILWQIAQVLISENVDSICSTQNGEIGDQIIDFICDGNLICVTVLKAIWTPLCEPLINLILEFETEPLKQQPTLIPTIASRSIIVLN